VLPRFGTPGFINGTGFGSLASGGIGSGAIGAGVVWRRSACRKACMFSSWRPFTVVFATSHTMLTATASPRAVAGANFMRYASFNMALRPGRSAELVDHLDALDVAFTRHHRRERVFGILFRHFDGGHR
jgi:hypothetical protein